MTATDKQPFTLVVVTAGTSDPSSTRMLADQLAQRVTDLAGRRGNEVATRVIDLRELANEVTTAMVSRLVSFFQVLDNDLLIAKPVVLAATAGTARHALVVDDQLRSLFAYLRATVVPTSLFAAPEDWSDPALTKRIDRAALELLLLMESGFARQVRDESWHSYQHEFGSAGGTELTIDLDSELMRLAAGGSAT
jgi:FMN reductase